MIACDTGSCNSSRLIRRCFDSSMNNTEPLRIEDGSLLRYCQRTHRAGNEQTSVPPFERRRGVCHCNEPRHSFGSAPPIYPSDIPSVTSVCGSLRPVRNSLVAWIAIGEYGCLEIVAAFSGRFVDPIEANQQTFPEETVEEIRLILQSSGIHAQVTVANPKECLHRALNSYFFRSEIVVGPPYQWRSHPV